MGGGAEISNSQSSVVVNVNVNVNVNVCVSKKAEIQEDRTPSWSRAPRDLARLLGSLRPLRASR